MSFRTSCMQCGERYTRYKENGETHFCSRDCRNKYQQAKHIVDWPCLNCGKTVKRKLSEYKKNKRVFCNKSCSMIFKNKKRWEKKRTLDLSDIPLKPTPSPTYDIYFKEFELAFDLTKKADYIEKMSNNNLLYYYIDIQDDTEATNLIKVLFNREYNNPYR